MRAHTHIYEPPSDDLPFLVVTFEAGEMKVVAANSRTDARKKAAEKRRKQP